MDSDTMQLFKNNMTKYLRVMESEQELIKARDDVLRKIGRNIVNFQKIEQLLKGVILFTRLSGYVSDLESNHKQNAEEIHSQPMGLLVKKYFDHIYSDASTTTAISDEITEPYISISLGISADAAFIENKKAALKALVDERNELVHHLLLRLDLLSIQSCLEMGKVLDEQRERQKEEYEHLAAQIQQIKDTSAEASAFFASDEGQKAIERCLLQQSPVISLLFDLTTSLARLDGWTLLNLAAQQVQALLPDELVNLKKRKGCKTLKEILLASELFEIESETTNNGGTRVLYRVKPELANIYH
jgi:hypothetical protein